MPAACRIVAGMGRPRGRSNTSNAGRVAHYGRGVATRATPSRVAPCGRRGKATGCSSSKGSLPPLPPHTTPRWWVSGGVVTARGAYSTGCGFESCLSPRTRASFHLPAPSWSDSLVTEASERYTNATEASQRYPTLDDSELLPTFVVPNLGRTRFYLLIRAHENLPWPTDC